MSKKVAETWVVVLEPSFNSGRAFEERHIFSSKEAAVEFQSANGGLLVYEAVYEKK